MLGRPSLVIFSPWQFLNAGTVLVIFLDQVMMVEQSARIFSWLGPLLWLGPKNVRCWPEIAILAISGSSCLKWVAHWSNWLEHCISYPGRSFGYFLPPWKCPWGCPGNGYFAPKSPYWSPLKWAHHWMNMVEYFISHPIVHWWYSAIFYCNNQHHH